MKKVFLALVVIVLLFTETSCSQKCNCPAYSYQEIKQQLQPLDNKG